MKLFFDIGHPAHVHYFKNLITSFKNEGYSIVISARDKEMTHELLDKLGFSYIDRGKGSQGILGKIIYLFQTVYKLYKIANKERPDLFISFGSPYCAQVSSLLRKPHIVIDDTENATFGQILYKPFSDYILTPDCFSKDMGRKQIRFPSYMELSYLHPSVFIPNESILDVLNLKKDEPYVLIRFVGWGAVHDIGHSGITIMNKLKTVQEFSKYARVFVSSESPLPDQLKPFEINIPKERMHDVLAFSSLFFGESATMASEAAVLGTPAIYLDNQGRGYTNELEHSYGLVYNYTEGIEDQVKAIKKGVEILQNSSREWDIKRDLLLKDKISLTTFLIDFIKKVLKKNYS